MTARVLGLEHPTMLIPRRRGNGVDPFLRCCTCSRQFLAPITANSELSLLPERKAVARVTTGSDGNSSAPDPHPLLCRCSTLVGQMCPTRALSLCASQQAVPRPC